MGDAHLTACYTKDKGLTTNRTCYNT